MPSVPEATDALRVALLEKGAESHAQDAFNNIASCLVLLNSSSPSVQMILKLCTVLRRPLLPLYNVCFQPALQLSSSVLCTVLGKLCDAHSIEDGNLRAALDATAEVVLSGILDFLDQKDGASIESDGAVWETLYRIICDFFFRDSDRGLPTFSIQLYLSAYNTLTEIAARHTTIRNAFRQRAVLGGERLGVAISGTRDYLLLEALLMLFARLLPPINTTSQGRLRRVKFVKEVLGSPKLFKCSAELLDILQKTSGTHWDDISANITDALARTDITYPQPFAIDEIDVCGRVFPQPLATDRLIMDKQAFLANIIAENDDICESLQIPYSHIRTITLDSSEKSAPKGKVLIMVYLTSPPLVANVEMKSLGASDLHAKFLLQNDSVGRFMEALRRRGVGKLSFLNPPTRVEGKRRSISIGSGFKFTNDSSPTPPTASFEGKVQRVNQVYKTDVEDSTAFRAVSLPQVECAGSDPQPPLEDEIPAPKTLESAVTKNTPATHKSATLILPTDNTSKPYQDFSFPGNSTRTTQLPDDIDELSEISEFEFDNGTANEGVEAKGSSNHEVVPEQRKTDRMQINEMPNATRSGVKASSESALKISDRAEGVAERSPETRKPLLTSDSPMFGPSSSTQIDVSPKLLSNADTLFTAIGTEIVDNLSVASLDFVNTDILKKKGAIECKSFETELAVAEAGKLPRAPDFARDGLRQHAGHLSRSPSAGQETHSCIDLTKDTSVPPSITGSRRKRESAKMSSKPITSVDDEYTPPRKRIRKDRLGIEGDKVESTETMLNAFHGSRVNGYTKTAGRSAPGTDPKLDEPAELHSTRRGTRRSSRIKERQAVATSGVRPNHTHGKNRKGKLVDESAGSERKNPVTVYEQDTSIEIGHAQSILSSALMVRSPLATQIENHAPPVELSGTGKNISGTNLRKCCSVVACSANQLDVTPGKESRENLDSVQEAVFDVMQPVQDQFCIKAEEIISCQHLVSDICTADNEVTQPQVSWVRKIAKYPVSLKESKDLMEPFRPTMESTPPMGAVTIDLTANNSPAQEKSEHKSSVASLRQEVNTRTRLGTPEQSDRVVIDNLASVPRNRHRCRSVTFASPIEYVLGKKVKSRMQPTDDSLSANPPRTCRPASSTERNTLSPLRIQTGTMVARHESSDVIPPRTAVSAGMTNNSTHSHIKASSSAHDQIVDDVGIQDIVDVLNEIQAVIIKGISDKFRNIRKDIQHSRDELIQQALDELRSMIVENANYFNGLLLLEEDYHKHCKALARCWEELIDCNDRIAIQFQNALKEHDRNVSARVFPKSLLPMQPVFPPRRANV